MLVHRCTLGARIKPSRVWVGIRMLNTLDKDKKEPVSNGSSQSNFQYLEPYWARAKDQLTQTNTQIKHYASQLKYHVDKAKEAIRTANKKLAEQELEGQDKRLTFNTDLETKGKIEGLPSERERKRRQWSKKLDVYLDSLQETIFTATRALNDVTGYSSIQKLRKSIDMMEHNLEETKREVKSSKEKYNSAIERRAHSQRELNELLQRKNSWSSQDLERFTQLYKDDALNLRQEEELKQALKDIETKEEDLSNNLYRAILTRYHEEQIWSDKIRRTSTWGTFLLMGMNILLFLVFQLLLEPWKRRRLVGSFEDKVKHALDEHAATQNVKLDEMSTHISTSMDKPPTDHVIQLSSETKGSNSTELSSVVDPAENSSSNLAFIPMNFSSWKTFTQSVRRNVHAVTIWAANFYKKLRQIQVTDFTKSATFTIPELYVYSTILLGFGVVIESILST